MAQGYGARVGWVRMLCLAGALTIAGCGSDGSSDGGICGGCGDSDGVCRSTADLEPDTNPAEQLCNNPADGCTVALFCRRKLDSAQRRCFPSTEADRSGPDPFFRCGGDRPNTEVRPTDTPSPTPDATPTPTFTPGGGVATPTPTPTSAVASSTNEPTVTPAPTPTPDAECGDGIIDDGEECDGTDELDTCADFCETDANDPVLCNPDCTYDFSQCPDPGACDPNGPPGF